MVVIYLANVHTSKQKGQIGEFEFRVNSFVFVSLSFVFAYVVVHFVRKHLLGAARVFFCAVHGRIGVPQDVLGRAAGGRGELDANAG